MYFHPRYPALCHRCEPALLPARPECKTSPVPTRQCANPGPHSLPFSVNVCQAGAEGCLRAGLRPGTPRLPELQTQLPHLAAPAPGIRWDTGAGETPGQQRLARCPRGREPSIPTVPAARHRAPAAGGATCCHAPARLSPAGAEEGALPPPHAAVPAAPRNLQTGPGRRLNPERAGQRCRHQRDTGRAPLHAAPRRPALQPRGSSPRGLSKLDCHICYTLVYFCIVLNGAYRTKGMYYL